MLGLYDASAARIRANCQSVVQTETAMDAQQAVEMLALGMDVTALVHPLGDTAAGVREAAMIVSQGERHLFGVTLALVAPGGIAQFETAREEIKSCLRGWMYPGASKPIEYVSGRLLQYQLGGDGGRMLWLLSFAAAGQQSYQVQS